MRTARDGSGSAKWNCWFQIGFCVVNDICGLACCGGRQLEGHVQVGESQEVGPRNVRRLNGVDMELEVRKGRCRGHRSFEVVWV
jgi:hypothetical protein